MFAVTAAVSVAQLVHPSVFHALHRDPAGLAAGQWWRAVTWMFVQDGWLAGTVFNLAILAVVGSAFERVFGSARWLPTYFVVGLIAQIPGFFWNPYGAGNSVPVAVLFGALVDLLIVGPRWFGARIPAAVRIWAVIVPVLAAVDTVLRDNHGIAVLLGMLVGLAMLWRRRGAGAEGR
ncbi:rhomboid family intramembrane serine protease [Pseudonocardia asaccharolytica DSM 44247 = NBRC 16224]|uniref:Rhomboid family intramembrane serine protease n=1 Tax=Pseudonocardia asaccharolytica DSM 44247 = NBRC 16224 TaxID=1123024 RepID=A0A511D6D7_9PSEU|nr:rhomboid family intramembrane serine protease [Pseudonocardia asaccharolytica DSM 44247 = NBRC 16224]